MDELRAKRQTVAPAPVIGVGDAPALRGIAAMLIGGAFFSVMDSLVKWVSPRFPLVEIIFCRSLFALVPIGVMAARQGGVAALRTRRLGGHAVRSLCGFASLFCF